MLALSHHKYGIEIRFTVDEIDINKFEFKRGVLRSKDAQTT